MFKIILFKCSLTVVVWLVADCGLLTYQVAQNYKRVVTLQISTNTAINYATGYSQLIFNHMTYDEFLNYEFKHNHLYNIVRICDNKDGLRGASVKSVHEMAELVGKDDIKIYIY